MNVEGKNVVVLGVADESSIAWAIARAFHDHGATVSIGFQQRFLSRVRVLLRSYPAIYAQRCDVTDEAELALFFERFGAERLDVLVHAIAYAAPELFTNPPSAADPGMFAESQQITAMSLASVVRHARPHLREWASVMTLTSEASTRAVPMYGLMGVAKATLESLVRYLALELGERKARVNAILAGPIETPAALAVVMAHFSGTEGRRTRAHGIAGVASAAVSRALGEDADDVSRASVAWKRVQRSLADRSAIDEVISADDVAGCALFLGSDYSRKITGQVLRVDGGLSSTLVV